MKGSVVDLKRFNSSGARKPSMILVFWTWKRGLSSQFLDLGTENSYARGALAKNKSSLYDRNDRESIDPWKPLFSQYVPSQVTNHAQAPDQSAPEPRLVHYLGLDYLWIKSWTCLACEPRTIWPKWLGIQWSMKTLIFASGPSQAIEHAHASD